MIHHPGEVIEVFRPEDKDVKSADNETLATVKMWDENVLTLVVDPKIARDIQVGDKVLVDYRPVSLGSMVSPKQLVTKIIDKERAERIWKEYKEYYQRQRKIITQPQSQSYIG
ncbi:MAG: hypothetical protein QW818_00605 [Candidatus Aenigmatarchaeota archaeon]|nr:hypothetical protein [Candidatus Aenigmarchaeota archaeon]